MISIFYTHFPSNINIRKVFLRCILFTFVHFYIRRTTVHQTGGPAVLWEAAGGCGRGPAASRGDEGAKDHEAVAEDQEWNSAAEENGYATSNAVLQSPYCSKTSYLFFLFTLLCFLVD